MKKFLLMVVAGVALFAVAVVVFVVMNINPIIEKSVNTLGPELTGAPVSLAESDISFLSGEGELRGLFVGNPEGFKTPHAFKLGSVAVKVDKSSLTSDRIIVNSIVIDSPDIIYERSGKLSNLDALVANVEDAVGTQGKAEQSRTQSGEQSPGGAQKLQIDDFVLQNAKVTLSMPVLGGKGMTVSLPDIHLQDIGSEGDGMTPAETVQTIMAELNRSISRSAQKAIGSIGEAIKKQGEGLKRQLDGIEGDVKQLFNQ